MTELQTLVTYLDNFLEINKVPEDYSNNGLQVQGITNVNKVLFAVDACSKVFDAAVEKNAQFIFVHHGISWKNGFRYLTGNTAKHLSTLFKNDISLYAAHLPLDAHSLVGHNALIANMVELQNIFTFANYCGIKIGYAGTVPSDMTTAQQIISKLESSLNTNCKLYGIEKNISKIGIISGGSGSEGILAAAKLNIDCLITGEVGHASWHLIHELGIQVIACGHYKSETPGVKAMMANLQNNFQIDCEFVDFPTGL